MKKRIMVITLLVILFLCPLPVSAGSIPGDLLTDDTAQIFFGQVVTYRSSKVTVVPLKTIKGDVELGKSRTYNEPVPIPNGEFHVRRNRVYLFTCVQENDPIYIYEASSGDPRTLELTGADLCWGKAVQQYLNNGEYEKAEAQRRERLGLGEAEPGPENLPMVDSKQEWIDAAVFCGVLLVLAGVATAVFMGVKKHTRSE